MAEEIYGVVSPESLAAFDKIRSEVEEEVVVLCMAEDEPQQYMGPNAESMIRVGLGFVSKMLRTTMNFAADEIMTDEVEWGKTRLPEYGVPAPMILRNFERYTKVLLEGLPQPAVDEIRPYVESMIAKQRGVSDADES